MTRSRFDGGQRAGQGVTEGVLNDGTVVRNVFASDGGASRRSDKVWTRDEPPFQPQPPLVAVPPAVLSLPEPAEPQAGSPADEQKDAGSDR